MNIKDPKVRRYIYAVAASAGPVVLFYGFMTAQEYAVWMGFAGTVLSVSNVLAMKNTPGPDE